MDSRRAASVRAFLSEGRVWGHALPRRNRLPSFHVSMPLPSAAGAADNEDDPQRRRGPSGSPSDAAGFLEYLRSDDTRLPSHKLIGTVSGQRTTEVDAWKSAVAARVEAARQQDDLPGSGGANDETAPEEHDGAVRPMPDFATHVEAVAAAISDLQDRQARKGDPDYGVVVGGASCVADDAMWATLTGDLRCIDARDVFSVLRCSPRVSRDIERQITTHRALLASGNDAGIPPALEATLGSVAVRLVRFMQMHPCFLYRAFVHYGKLVAVSQRSVDQIHEYLVGLGAEEHAAVFEAIRANVEDTLLKRLQELWPGLLGDGVSLLADVYYEGGTLPVFVLSCRFVHSLATSISGSVTEEQAAAQSDFGAQADAGSGGSTHEQDAEVFDPQAFRIFGSFAGMVAFALGRDTMQGDAAAAELDAAVAAGGETLRKEIGVARSHDDLHGDGKLMSQGVALPAEVANPELFDIPPDVRDMLLQVQRQQMHAM